MKKIDKLQIIPEKLMKNEELLTLRGGYDPLCCTCILKDPPYDKQGYMVADGPWQCSILCHEVNPNWLGSWSC